jgi:hypothetical protein
MNDNNIRKFSFCQFSIMVSELHLSSCSSSNFFFQEMPTSSPQSFLVRSDNNPIQFTHQLHTTLTNDNYLVWKSQILPVHRGYDLMCYIDGTAPPSATLPASSDGAIAMNPAFQQWHRQDQLILAWIFNSISSSICQFSINYSYENTLRE